MLEFNAENHTYTDGGILIPSVTTVMDLIHNYCGIPEKILERASERGTAVHLATELYDEGRLDMGSLSDEILGYVMGWMKFKSDTGFQPEMIEYRVYSKKHRYAGTLDRTGLINGKLAIIDVKTTAQFYSAFGVQLGGYMNAYNEGTPAKDKVKTRWVVKLSPDGDYKLQQYKDRSDVSIFLNCLNLYNWRQHHNE